jgi:hypothetical protein
MSRMRGHKCCANSYKKWKNCSFSDSCERHVHMALRLKMFCHGFVFDPSPKHLLRNDVVTMAKMMTMSVVSGLGLDAFPVVEYVVTTMLGCQINVCPSNREQNIMCK